MAHYLTDEEINNLIKGVKSGDNAAWEQLCGNFDCYIHDNMIISTGSVRRFFATIYRF